MNDLEGVSTHIHDKISSLQHLLDLSDLPQNKLKKLGQEVCALGRLLEELETCVGQQKEQLHQLKDLEATFQKYLEDLQHMNDHIPAHMPGSQPPASDGEPTAHRNDARELQPSEVDQGKKPDRSFVREMEFVTVPEFESIPQYMKGRVTYDQLNAAVQHMNTAVKAKYRILHQPLKGLNNHSRKLHARFKEQETKATKGQYFVVEDDVRELAQVKVDKRFQGILNMLRHCQRLRELRGGGLTRYVLL
ncbi:SKA complex subunit 1 [Takifugu rubripes]|uniref:SKA complex subunit 1 n=2 Tax=Takifugu TaxID=31032 RepID=H2V5G4_TAKRU|nr:spindle and kinetochore-associated protein 1 [Takifugu rubripes]XP_056907175.1 spindle and kinetochore-associated protein 1 [Takifugu flavidus]|eukprot:XP_003976041.1 PREDICTED: spindle and kinetochore-associated protein 1 [Takifugu rubripes]